MHDTCVTGDQLDAFFVTHDLKLCQKYLKVPSENLFQARPVRHT